jgi:glycosyltransferase involved in cell wall biosynthesis
VDGTGELCQTYAEQDPRLSYSRTSSYLNAADNFQRVLDMARGSYFMWAACDDWWHPDFVAAMVKDLELRPEDSVCMSAVERRRESGDPIDIVRHVGSRNPSRMSAPRLAIALARGEPYHLYIYGLYRTDFLRKALIRFPRVAGGDRLLVCQVALATKFGYVDQVLHTRYMSDIPLGKRYSNEELGRLWRDPLQSLRMAAYAGPYLLRSQIVPWRRKLIIPVVVLLLASWRLELYLRGLAARLLKALGLWSVVKRIRDSLGIRSV